jgi:hypothetical protein
MQRRLWIARWPRPGRLPPKAELPEIHPIRSPGGFLLEDTMFNRNVWINLQCDQCGAEPGSDCRGLHGAKRETPHRARVKRGFEERDFWRWVDTRMTEPDTAGMTEQQFLDTVTRPGWRGMKARTAPPQSSGMAQGLDRKMAAANDAA